MNTVARFWPCVDPCTALRGSLTPEARKVPVSRPQDRAGAPFRTFTGTHDIGQAERLTHVTRPLAQVARFLPNLGRAQEAEAFRFSCPGHFLFPIMLPSIAAAYSL